MATCCKRSHLAFGQAIALGLDHENTHSPTQHTVHRQRNDGTRRYGHGDYAYRLHRGIA